jgi:DNA-damage-inducible protein J
MYIVYTAHMATLNIRIEEKTKEKARKALSEVGLDLSSGIKLFLHQVVVDKGLPFRPTKDPAVLRAKWDMEAKEALKSGKRYGSGKETLRDIL